VSAEELHEARCEEETRVREMITEWTNGGHGYVPQEKPDEVLRLSVENVNSLSIYHPTDWKVKKLRAINNRYNTDATLLLESGVNWAQAPDERTPQALLGGRKCRVSTGYNVHESGPEYGRYQHGGTLAAAFARLSSFVLSVDEDPTGLGRWSSLRVGTEERRTRLVAAYRPCRTSEDKKPKRQQRRMTVWAQHRRYFKKRGIFHSPRLLFTRHLVAQLRQWRAAGDEIILFLDANEDLYRGDLAKELQGDDLLMTEQVLQSTGQEAPFSHQTGKIAISGTYATPGIVCRDSYVAPHGSGVGDHRLQIHDFCARSVLGIDYPKLVKPAGRKLRCDREKSVKTYNRVLKQLYLRHRAFEKLEELRENYEHMTAAEFQLTLNSWDREVTQMKLAAEARCGHNYAGQMEYSEGVGIWWNRLRIYRWMIRFKSGRVKDARNLFRQCKRHHLPQPRDLSVGDIAAREANCLAELVSLRRRAPELRVKFLRERLDAAKEREDPKAIHGIRRILRREAIRKRWRKVKFTVNPEAGGAVTRVKVPSPGGASVFATKEGVESQAGPRMNGRFRLGRRAPICADDRLHQDFGFLGDTEATRQVLEGTYAFPEGIDPHTKMLLEEAHTLFSSMEADEVSNYVTTSDFQYYWRKAKEDTQSSESRCHFGMYKAISRDECLSSLEAAKLSLCAETGVPLERWGNGLTVLLEKVAGNIYIEKMRAICLLEADYNWLNKLVFAKRMMSRAREEGIVPLEQFAKSGCQAAEGVLATGFFCDIARALHRTAAVESVDLANCYDAVAHPIANLALQSFKVRATMVAMMLSVLQTMKFYLRTGFGQSTTSYGGTKDDPTMGLAQGNGAAPPGFLAVSTLMIDVYKRLGHGVNFTSAWSGDAFYLAAILYVDDSDLLHMSLEDLPEDEEFLDLVQRATFDWGGLVQATGGSLKPSKCFWYMLSWRWSRGKPLLKKRSQLPSVPLMIPQPDGANVPIALKEVTESEKKLGVWTCPAGDFGVHVSEMKKKGKKWAARMRNGCCPPRDAWLGLRHQLWRQMSYGLVAVSHPPNKLEKAVQSVWFECLPFLKVNRHIRLEWRTLPLRYQGLALPHVNIELLGRKLHLIQRHWGCKDVTGNFLLQAYEVFQVEVGLGGNIFERDFTRYGMLATNGWFKNLWQLCHRYRVRFVIRDHDIPLLREGDEPVMERLLRLNAYSPTEIVRLNRVRKFLKIHCLGDAVLSDGITLRPEVVEPRAGISKRQFPVERPTRSDKTLWRQSLNIIASPQLKLIHPLGCYTSDPHGPDDWFTNDDRDALYYRRDDGMYDVFERGEDGIQTRFGSYYFLAEEGSTEVSPTRRASITEGLSPTRVRYHSSAPLPSPSPRPDSVEAVLRSWGHRSLWRSLHVDGDGSWIRRAMILGTLVVVHDGSYKEKVARDVCTGAVALRCVWTRKRARCAWTERTDRWNATNYRGEVLGGILALVILRAATEGYAMPSFSRVVCGCDNMGVVSHGNEFWAPLQEKQCQGDLLRVLKRLVATAPVRPRLKHVYGHQDDHVEYEKLDDLAQTNVDADRYASEDLEESVASGRYITGPLPFDDIGVSVGSHLVTGSPTQAIWHHWGHKEARRLFHERGIVDRRYFNLIVWDGVESAMKGFPEMFRIWVTKQVSHFCGTNRQLSRIHTDVKNVCPSCGRRDESTRHITRCRDAGRTAMFSQSVTEIVSWLESKRTDPTLVSLFQQYLLGRGTVRMQSLVGRDSRFHQAARFHDQLGWDNFVEGRLCILWVHHRESDIERWDLRSTAESWAKGLIHRLLELTHRQWIYRNTAVHFVTEGGLTAGQHDRLMSRVEDFAAVDPADLLPEDKALLEVDFDQLGDGTAREKQFWVAEMASAVAAADHVKQGSTQTLRSRYALAPAYDTRQTTVASMLNSKGSIRWKRRRKRSRQTGLN